MKTSVMLPQDNMASDSSSIAEAMSWTFTKGPFRIRPINADDNGALKEVLLAVLSEYGCIGSGYSSSDPETQAMSQYYDGESGQYWVVENIETGQIVGGGGFNRLKGTAPEEAICELQKLYFLGVCRGHGLGVGLIHHCMEAARLVGYTIMYLETVPQMSPAARLYERLGFKALSSHWGATGHHERCTLRYARRISDDGKASGEEHIEDGKPHATVPGTMAD